MEGIQCEFKSWSLCLKRGRSTYIDSRHDNHDGKKAIQKRWKSGKRKKEEKKEKWAKILCRGGDEKIVISVTSSPPLFSFPPYFVSYLYPRCKQDHEQY
jgi:hypothetical protein